MDEWTLNDLLECSVCLERLDTSSKVLPCQHTFCKKCLEEIVSTHKELRCPECRILVDCSVEELPPNVLLMRILEGMKNAGNLVPKKKVNTQKLPLQISTQQNPPNQAYNNGENFKPPNTIQKQNQLPNQCYGLAICDYLSQKSEGLSFRKGEIIYLHKRVDVAWYQGECGGRTGIFPASFIKVITPLPDEVATCKALYDFRMVNDEDEGCLTFHKDDIITVIRRVDENWAEGKLNENIGIFPLAFVEMNLIAQALMKMSINTQPGPSRIAPPTPTAEESAPLIPGGHSGATSNNVSLHPPNQNNVGTISQHNSPTKAQTAVPTAVTASESGSTVSSTTTPSSSSFTPNSSSNTSSSSNSEPNSPPSNQPAPNPNPFLPASQPPWPIILQTSHITNSTQGILPTSHILGPQLAVGSDEFTGSVWPSPQRRDVSDYVQHLKEKRHSFSAVSTNPHHSAYSNKHGVESSNSESTSDNQNGLLIRHGSQRHKRSGSDKTSAVNLPAGYVALYPYKPQKADELELKKGGIYLVTERCQDGWFKGTSSKTQKSGMFPGNYVTPVKPMSAIQSQPRGTPPREATMTTTPSQKPVHRTVAVKMPHVSQYGRLLVPPELPPRASSPSNRPMRAPAQNCATPWHPPQNDFSPIQKSAGEGATNSQANLGATFVVADPRTTSSASASPVPSASVSTSKSAEKVKDKKEKSGLIKRLTTIKRSKSPPASASYSMDNPVFDDASASSLLVQPHSHPVHLRSGSCPSQLIRVSSEGGSHHRTFSASVSARLKHRERPSVSNANFTQSTSRPAEGTMYSKSSTSACSSHRKSNSLDAGDPSRKPRQLVPTVRERFRCIVPYPPNTEYELELKVGDIIYVHKKRDDGWYKGTQQRTGRTGLFPASFVETC